MLFFIRKLAGKTLFITGASRGIGKSIALKAARDGANIVIAAKTATPHPKLPGTIYTAAKESMLRNHSPCHFLFFFFLPLPLPFFRTKVFDIPFKWPFKNASH